MSYNAKEHADRACKAAIEDPTPERERGYMDFLENVQLHDLRGLRKAEKSYGDSWKRRGGVGAFMMLARKWDRIENALAPGRGASQGQASISAGTTEACAPYDIFRAVEVDGRAEGLIDDIRDLRRYLLLVEGELRARGLSEGEVAK